ncbi:MAG: type secretion system domain, type pilus assembly protein PilC [Parcubacteria group bacterium]|nr:type secretion system domain, type pilus assembly protein PilC [Parcubacteria group bacterium]
MRAGVPLLESLRMLEAQTHSAHARTILRDVSAEVEQGHSLSRSFSAYPKVFGVFGANIIAIGESSGTLPRTLEYFADELKKKHLLTRRVVSACIYPAVITFATIAITGFLILYLFPRIMPVFLSLHMKLPLTTRIVIGLSSFLMQWGWLVLLVLFAAAVGLTLGIARSEHMRRACDSATLRIPLVGAMIRNYHLANAMRTLGLLLASEVPVTESMRLTATTATNRIYKEEYFTLAERVLRGERISDHLLRTPRLFPPVLGQMVAVGERSGTLAESVLYLSDLYEADVEEFTRTLSSLIEPVLMILMGIVVGFISISIITPIYGITQNLHS